MYSTYLRSLRLNSNDSWLDMNDRYEQLCYPLNMCYPNIILKQRHYTINLLYLFVLKITLKLAQQNKLFFSEGVTPKMGWWENK